MDLKGTSGFSSSCCSCILFEASGDSEGDFDPNMGVGGGYSDEVARFGGYDLRHGHVVDVVDDDDAMSCSYDRSEYSCNAAAEANGNWGESNSDVADDIDEEHDGDGNDVMKKEEKDGVYGTSYCDDDDDEEILQEEHNHKLFVSFDSKQEFVDEMEKNRLFWEACLAS